MHLGRLPEKIYEFLHQRPKRMYCDSCIQERLGLRWRRQVQLITAALAVTEIFKREHNTCCTCNLVKSVTYAVERAPQSAAHQPRPGPQRAAHTPSRYGPTSADLSRLALPARPTAKQTGSASN